MRFDFAVRVGGWESRILADEKYAEREKIC